MSEARKTLFSMIQSQVKGLSVEETFQLEYTQTVQKMNKPKRGSIFYKPSSMNCKRQMFYIARGKNPDDVLPSYSIVRICESGTDSHERIQGYVSKMRDNGFDCDWIDPKWYIENMKLDYLVVQDKAFCEANGLEYHGEKPFETKLYDKRYNLSFLCDGIIRFHGKYYILEIKTEADWKNMNRTEADEKHRNQARCYSLSMGINDVIWIYESRNFCNVQVFHTHIEESDKAEIVYAIEEVDQCLRELRLPPKTTEQRNCQYCDYRSLCSKGEV